MSKNFKSNLKHWLSKVYILNKRNKKTVMDIANRLTLTDIKEPKNQIQNIIVDNILNKFTELKLVSNDSNEGYLLIEQFLNKNSLTINARLRESISKHILKYFSFNEQNIRNYKDYISNVWNRSLNAYDCICAKRIKSSEIIVSQKKIVCYRCTKQFHSNCMGINQNNEEYQQCPLCFLINCLPNKKVINVLFAGYLRQTKKQKIQYKIDFFIDIPHSQECLFQARSICLSQNARYQISWPTNSTLVLNSKKIMDYKPLNMNSCFKRRVDDEVIFDKKTLSNHNTFIVQQKLQNIQGYRPYNSQNYLIVIVAVLPLRINQIIQETKKNTLCVQKSKQNLKNYLNRSNQDCIIDKFSVTTQCQFYNAQISIPVRSIHCNCHYQPIDLKSFLLANLYLKSSSQKWKCPICRKRAYHLIVDEYLLQLMSNGKKKKKIEFIIQNDNILVSEDAYAYQIQVQKPVKLQNDYMLKQDIKIYAKKEQDYYIDFSRYDEIQLDGQDASSKRYWNTSIQARDQYIQIIQIQESIQQISKLQHEYYKDTFKHRQDYSSERQDHQIQGEIIIPSNKSKSSKNRSHNSKIQFSAEIQCISVNQNDKDKSLEIQSQEELQIESQEEEFNPKVNIKKKIQKERFKRKSKKIIDQLSKRQQQSYKTIAPSPMISTVIPQAIRILEKKLPELHKEKIHQAPIFEIERGQESAQQKYEKKIQCFMRQLHLDTQLFRKRQEEIYITKEDEALFLHLCERVMLN